MTGSDGSGGGGRFKARAGLLAVVGLLYASACGGPYGTEEYVVQTGPGLLILLLFVAPWIWGVPMAFATAELSSARPVEGGFLRWIRETLGEFWGFQAGIWTLTASFLDNALYPVLFAKALGYWIPGMNDNERWIAAVLFIAVLTYLNYLGIQIAGRVAVGLNLFLIAPLVWIVVEGFAKARFNPLTPFAPMMSDPWSGLGQGLVLSIWFYSGYSEVSSAAEEMERPERAIPLALLIVTPLVVLSYAAPTLAGLAAYGNWQGWRSGEFATIGETIGGPLLGHWAFLGSVASFTVIFIAYLLWYSRLAWAMAADGSLPVWFSRLHPRYGTPYRTLLMYAVGYSILARWPFDELLTLNLWIFGAYDLLIVASAIRGRKVYADRPPGFRIPGGTPGVWINALLPATAWVIALAATWTDYWRPGIAGLLLAPTLYAGREIARRLTRRSGRAA
jgi:amino acid transporter